MDSGKKKVMLCVAPVCAADTVYDPEKVAADVADCARKGACMVHLHVRDRHGALTSDLSVLEETVRLIRKECDIVVEVSTGGVSDLTIEERCAPCEAPYVELNSLNVGSVNLGKAVYKNPIDEVHYCVSRILENRKIPETELFELGMVHTLCGLTKEHDFPRPLLLALVFGHEGEMPATRPALEHMVQFLSETFGEKEEFLWGYTQAGRRDWEMVEYALRRGAFSVRIGFEDSDYLSPGERVSTNAPLIEKAAQLIRETGSEPMTAGELREMLKLPVPGARKVSAGL